MNENRLPDYLEHMQKAATDACSFIDGMDKADFDVDKRTQQAVVMSLFIIGKGCVTVLLTVTSTSTLMLYGKRYRQPCQRF